MPDVRSVDRITVSPRSARPQGARAVPRLESTGSPPKGPDRGRPGAGLAERASRPRGTAAGLEGPGPPLHGISRTGAARRKPVVAAGHLTPLLQPDRHRPRLDRRRRSGGKVPPDGARALSVGDSRPGPTGHDARRPGPAPGSSRCAGRCRAFDSAARRHAGVSGGTPGKPPGHDRSLVRSGRRPAGRTQPTPGLAVAAGNPRLPQPGVDPQPRRGVPRRVVARRPRAGGGRRGRG